MVVEVIGEVTLPYWLGKIINQGIAAGDTAYILTVGAVMVITSLIMMLGGVGAAYFATKASVNFASDLREDLFRKVQNFSFSNMDQFSAGSLITRMTNDITQVQNMVAMGMRMMLRAPGMLIGALIMAFVMNAKLALIILVIMPVLVIIILSIMKAAFPRFDYMQRKLDSLNTNIQEMLTNIRVIKSFVRGEYEEEVFSRSNQELKDASVNAYKVVILQMPLMTIFMNLTTLTVVWFGGKQILDERMPVGDLSSFILYITQILMSLMMLAMILLQSTRAIASARRIAEVLDAEIDLTDELAAHKEEKVQKGNIRFKNVTFRYYKEREEKVLDNINLDIKAGETVGIIGSTGCGKTTLVQMIPRLYDVDEGEVLVDGINVKDYSLKHLRDGVGMVLQKNILFSGSILENLSWGNQEAKRQEIEKVAETAQAHSFISSFTDGYDTSLGQGGVNVSGGQKQRLCIARALLKEPRILILDDSTSAVDTATETKIREAFQGALKENTKIVIAQRISSVMDADQIVVMDEGKIVGIGTHLTLLQSCEPYQEIYASQMEETQKEVTA